jgi:hypothetical protein
MANGSLESRADDDWAPDWAPEPSAAHQTRIGPGFHEEGAGEVIVMNP